METLQALHVIYKLALLGLIWLIVMYLTSNFIAENILEQFGRKVFNRVHITLGAICCFAYGAIAVAIVYFFIQLF